MNWQPIETAPKDGTRILVNDGCNIYKAFFDDDKYAFLGIMNGYTENYFILMSLVEWQPLPEIKNDQKNRR